MKQYDFTKEEMNCIPLVQEQKEEKLHKYRLFSTYSEESLDLIEITDEQVRLLKYLQNVNFLGDEIDFEECGTEIFKRI